MTKVEQLQAALVWALKEGARAVDYGSAPIEFRDKGCGCCSGDAHPPEEIRSVLIEAGRIALRKDQPAPPSK